MSVVIIGGNKRMECMYKDICKKHKCKAKVFTQPSNNLECMMGSPDLIVLFTNPVSHEMATIARKKAAQQDITLAQAHSGSANTLHNILAQYAS